MSDEIFDPRKVELDYLKERYGGLLGLHSALTEIAMSPEPMRRKLVSDLLRLSGVAPSDYMPWTAEQRATYIVKHFYG